MTQPFSNLAQSFSHRQQLDRMPPRGQQVPLLKRAAILTLHWHAEKSWIEISTLLLVHPETARKICLRAKERATDPTNFDDVLQHLEDAERPGRRHKDPKQKKPQKPQKPQKPRAVKTTATRIENEYEDVLEGDGSGGSLDGKGGEGDGEFEWVE